MTSRRLLPTVLAACLLLALLLAGPATATPSPPAWKLTVTPNADYFLPGPENEENAYTIEAENVGEEATAGAIRLEDLLPAGWAPARVRLFASPVGFNPRYDDLAEAGDCPGVSKCEYPGSPAIAPGERLIMVLGVAVPATAHGRFTDVARVSGGGALKASASAANEVSADPPLGFHSFEAKLTDFSKTAPYTQAAGHPFQLAADFRPATRSVRKLGPNDASGWYTVGITPVGDPRDIAAELPPGLIGNPQAVPTCELADFFVNRCPIKTVIGTVASDIGGEYQNAGGFYPLYNLQPAGAYPGELGYVVNGFSYFLTASLRSGSDYGLTITDSGVPTVGLTHARVITWGIPAAPEHDAMRGKECSGKYSQGENFIHSLQQIEEECETEPGTGRLHGGPAEVKPTPFLTMPSRCSAEPLSFGMRYDVWQNAEETRAGFEGPAVGGCNQLAFTPTIEAHPTTNLPDAPSGLQFDLHVPQQCWQEKETAAEVEGALCQSDLSEAVVKLPPGLNVNPSSANGLAGCSPEQIGLTTPVGTTPAHFTEEPAGCPDESKIGLAEVKTPLLHEPLGSIAVLPGRVGAVYLATPHRNPYESLLAAYIVLEGQGLIIKLPGKIEADPQTGQITGRFTENPQTPFEDFHLRFFEGARGDLRTPATCGTYETTAELTPYSHMEGETEATPIAHKSSSFETTNGGAPCPHSASEEPNAPVFRAGTESTQAGAFSPFAFKLRREDGSQEFSKIETTLPPGLVGKLAGVGECSEAQLATAKSREREGGGAEEQASPSCPSSSEVGTVEVAAGAGPTPYITQGKAYLAGPYKGAPLSLAIITPAVAGPFDLGDVLVRTALYVDPETAQIKAVSDEIPHILQGIPLDVKSVTLKMDRPDFTLNPTNCNEMAFSGSETSVLGASAPLAQRFQVGGCSVLPFNPKLAILLKGSTKRTGHPALKAVLTMKPGQANIARAQVTLPHSEFLDNAHIGTVCTRVQFAEGNTPGERCPPGSIYGHAKAVTPLLDAPVEGPVYLMGGFGHQLPDLAAALNGQIDVLLHGKVDTGRTGGIRNTFEVVPDAPVSKFTLEMQGGRKGLLVNSESLCSKPHRAIADFSAQNGKVSDTEPVVKARCARPRKGKGKHRKRH